MSRHPHEYVLPCNQSYRTFERVLLTIWELYYDKDVPAEVLVLKGNE